MQIDVSAASKIAQYSARNAKAATKWVKLPQTTSVLSGMFIKQPVNINTSAQSRINTFAKQPLGAIAADSSEAVIFPTLAEEDSIAKNDQIKKLLEQAEMNEYAKSIALYTLAELDIENGFLDAVKYSSKHRDFLLEAVKSRPGLFGFYTRPETKTEGIKKMNEDIAKVVLTDEDIIINLIRDLNCSGLIKLAEKNAYMKEIPLS